MNRQEFIYELSLKINEYCAYNYSNIPKLLEWLFGGTVNYYYDYNRKVHEYRIKNDDMGEYEWSVLNKTFTYEPMITRIYRMCEEYDGYMRYKYRDYEESDLTCQSLERSL